MHEGIPYIYNPGKFYIREVAIEFIVRREGKNKS